MPAILLTRPEPAARAFADALRGRLGPVEVIVSPLLRIEWREDGAQPEGTAIFTSPSGVEGFARAWGKAAGAACWCVGDATARAAGEAGFQARSASGDAGALIRAIVESGDKGPFCHLRGAHARGDVAENLRKAGRICDEVVIYDQVAQPPSDAARAWLDGSLPVIVPLFSPRTAALFAACAPFRAPLFVAAMSAAVGEALGDLGCVRVTTATRPDAAAMQDAVQGLFDAALVLEGRGGAQ
jgi:uroporphyrinogen-III synthase